MLHRVSVHISLWPIACMLNIEASPNSIFLPTLVKLVPYSIFILRFDVSSLLINKILHYAYTTSFSCHMQGSSLVEGKSKYAVEKLAK